MTVDHLNQMTAAEAEQTLLACCGALRWAKILTAGRPYATPAAVLDAADREWWNMGDDDWIEALNAHPRIGDRASGDASARREQQAVATAGPGTLATLAAANREYEARFGHRFVVFASGRSGEDLLAALELRMENDPEDELRIAAGEQARITRLRLERLLEMPS
jgi:2-oxo-4-hydroxy-4-carboxy-5-ureidoimidazoline decarboxylase